MGRGEECNKQSIEFIFAFHVIARDVHGATHRMTQRRTFDFPEHGTIERILNIMADMPEMIEEGATGSLVRTAKDLSAGAVGGIAQVLLGRSMCWSFTLAITVGMSTLSIVFCVLKMIIANQKWVEHQHKSRLSMNRIS